MGKTGCWAAGLLAQPSARLTREVRAHGSDADLEVIARGDDALHNAQDARLGDSVANSIRPIERRHGAREHDAPQSRVGPLVIDEVPERNARRVQHADEVNVDRLHVGLGELARIAIKTGVETSDLADARVGKHDVNVPERLGAGFEQGDLVVPGRHVALGAHDGRGPRLRRHLLHRLGEAGRVDIAEHHLCTQFGELERGCAPEARAGARDEDDAAAQSVGVRVAFGGRDGGHCALCFVKECV